MIFSLVMTALLSLSMIGFGSLFLRHPPKDINDIFGYRTAMSSKNQDTWDFAHKYSGKVWVISGIVSGVISFILLVSLRNNPVYGNIMAIIIFAQIAVLLLVIPITEIKLRKTFDKDGKRKE